MPAAKSLTLPSGSPLLPTDASAKNGPLRLVSAPVSGGAATANASNTSGTALMMFPPTDWWPKYTRLAATDRRSAAVSGEDTSGAGVGDVVVGAGEVGVGDGVAGTVDLRTALTHPLPDNVRVPSARTLIPDTPLPRTARARPSRSRLRTSLRCEAFRNRTRTTFAFEVMVRRVLPWTPTVYVAATVAAGLPTAAGTSTESCSPTASKAPTAATAATIRIMRLPD